MNILIIEDDAAIRQELKLLLENALYQVTVLTEFHHVVEDILQMEPDLILLDVNLPQQSGFEICKSVRKTSDVPIIFLTSRTDSMDELSGMLQGGDDYITKPFQPPLLLAHIAAVLKRAKKADVTEKMICKGVELDVVRGCVKCQEQQVDLSKNELKILHYLFLHQGEIVPRIELVEYLWDQKLVYATLLRQKEGWAIAYETDRISERQSVVAAFTYGMYGRACYLFAADRLFHG